jgi:hypothetical protein
MSFKSFKDARKAFSVNLTAILAALAYTPASLSMKLNAEATANGSVKSILSASEIFDWMSNKKIPSLYAAFKLATFLKTSIDELLDPNFNVTTVVARSFAIQSTTTPKISPTKVKKVCGIPVSEMIELLQPIKDAEVQLVQNMSDEILLKNANKTTLFDSLKDSDFLNAASTTSIAMPVKQIVVSNPKVIIPTKSTTDLAKISVEKHTTSKKYNAKLAYAILNSNLSVKDVAKACNIGASTLRGYMYYNVPVPKDVASLILKTIKACNYATLGLKFDTTKTKFVHQTV